jgi:hypothetical protein
VKFNDYLEKLRRKPARERERIAVIATAAAFLVFFGIWLVSFSENGKEIAPEQSSSSIDEQLGDLKNSIGQGKQSIQDMMQDLPQNQGLDGSVAGSQPASDTNGIPIPSGDLNTSQNSEASPQNPTSNENNAVAPDNIEQNTDQNNQNQPQNNSPSGNNIPQLP